MALCKPWRDPLPAFASGFVVLAAASVVAAPIVVAASAEAAVAGWRSRFAGCIWIAPGSAFAAISDTERLAFVGAAESAAGAFAPVEDSRWCYRH